ncbi:hypothetical protein SDRG_04915 [Saprolegnia diclina VS20]|uniref:CLASP N-terminal domain-containing protein n=1 Tax=Saprolegnia diclina (strain VS20) TaxID=1156394 RepID=T0S515_SAPDV|nr:hypothetical protein SDRG_04915 [Saprolegnia diclina VS20]EQC37897.1 hypothetical protein SDRG_04915 [Saprolegnia diclina VS20]|eukprot:XP_008608830.1 hypothetical protein SDRG_04915 [Saprolegnia diclina VS20]
MVADAERRMESLRQKIEFCEEILSNPEAAWVSRVTAMKQLETAVMGMATTDGDRDGANFNATPIVGHLLVLVNGFLHTLADCRPAVAKQACSLVSSLAWLCGPPLRPLSEALLLAVFHLATKKKQTQVIALSARQCLHSLTKATRYPVALLERAYKQAKDDGDKRMLCVSLIVLVLRFWPPYEVLERSNYMAMRRVILQSLFDDDAAVQSQARLSLCLLCEYGQENIRFLLEQLPPELLACIADEFPDSMLAQPPACLESPSEDDDDDDDDIILSPILELDDEDHESDDSVLRRRSLRPRPVLPSRDMSLVTLRNAAKPLELNLELSFVSLPDHLSAITEGDEPPSASSTPLKPSLAPHSVLPVGAPLPARSIPEIKPPSPSLIPRPSSRLKLQVQGLPSSPSPTLLAPPPATPTATPVVKSAPPRTTETHIANATTRTVSALAPSPLQQTTLSMPAAVAVTGTPGQLASPMPEDVTPTRDPRVPTSKPSLRPQRTTVFTLSPPPSLTKPKEMVAAAPVVEIVPPVAPRTDAVLEERPASALLQELWAPRRPSFDSEPDSSMSFESSLGAGNAREQLFGPSWSVSTLSPKEANWADDFDCSVQSIGSHLRDDDDDDDEALRLLRAEWVQPTDNELRPPSPRSLRPSQPLESPVNVSVETPTTVVVPTPAPRPLGAPESSPRLTETSSPPTTASLRHQPRVTHPANSEVDVLAVRRPSAMEVPLRVATDAINSSVLHEAEWAMEPLSLCTINNSTPVVTHVTKPRTSSTEIPLRQRRRVGSGTSSRSSDASLSEMPAPVTNQPLQEPKTSPTTHHRRSTLGPVAEPRYDPKTPKLTPSKKYHVSHGRLVGRVPSTAVAPPPADVRPTTSMPVTAATPTLRSLLVEAALTLVWWLSFGFCVYGLLGAIEAYSARKVAALYSEHLRPALELQFEVAAASTSFELQRLVAWVHTWRADMDAQEAALPLLTHVAAWTTASFDALVTQMQATVRVQLEGPSTV